MSVMAAGERLRPVALCPKCGTHGFLDATPRYVEPDSDDTFPGDTIPPKGCLVWECVACGYRIVTATADA